jgi:hypothetical protein
VISKLPSFKNVKKIYCDTRTDNVKRDYKLLDILINNNKKKYDKNKYKFSQFSLVNYKNKPQSIMLYEKPQSHLILQVPLKNIKNIENINKIIKENDVNYYRLGLLSITGLSTLSFCSYGYLIFNNLELLLLL